MNNFNDYIQSITVRDPMGLLNPGVIIIGETTENGNEYYPSRFWEEISGVTGDYVETSKLPSVDNPEYSLGDIVKVNSTFYILRDYPHPVYYQYKVNNEKFIGFIGDLAEYGFKHIPEKFYYNNISNLDLLCEDSQYTIGSRFPVLKAISDNAVFTEICKEDYINHRSLPDTLYDKFRPHYFGTAVQGDRTILMFIIPPGYNKVSIAGEIEIYNKKDYFSIYGPDSSLMSSYIEYMEANPSFNSSYHTNGVIDNYNINLNINPVNLDNILINPKEVITDYENVATIVNTNSDDVDTGGRGRNGGQTYHGNTTVTAISGDYSLIYNDYTGTEMIVPNNYDSVAEFYDTDANSALLDYWTIDSDYEFKKLADYTFYIKIDPKKTRTSYQHITNVDDVLANWDAIEKEYILEKINPVDSGNYLVNLTGLNSSISLKIDDSGYYYKFDEDNLILYTTTSSSKLNSSIYNRAKSIAEQGEDPKFWDIIIQIGNNYYQFTGKTRFYYYILNSSTFKRINELVKWTGLATGEETWKIFKKFTYSDTQYYGSRVWRGDTWDGIVPNLLPNNGWYWEVDPRYLGNAVSVSSLPILPSSLYQPGSSLRIQYKGKYYKVSVVGGGIYVKDYINNSGSNSSQSYVTPTSIDFDHDKINWVTSAIDWTDSEKNYYLYIQNKSSLDINLSDIGRDYYRLIKIVISPKETKEYSWKITSYTTYKEEVESLPLLPNNKYRIGDVVKIIGQPECYILTFTNSPTIESINLVNLGYKTSDNPLENLDKYLIREEGYVPKYSKTSLGVVDLTSGTYLSKGFRKNNEEDTISGKRYSFRKTYRKGQSVLVGLPDNLNEDIVDIQKFILDSEEAIEDLGSIVYDYYRGEVYRYRRFNWKKINNFDPEESNYKETVSSLPISVEEYNEGDIIRLSGNSYEFYELVESDNNSGILKEESYNSNNNLFRYCGEYFFWENRQTTYVKPTNNGQGEATFYACGLVRGNLLGVRTWISTENNNSKNLPWASRYWMSNDGELNIGDRVWVIITYNNLKQKLLGTIKKRSGGTCLSLESKFPITPRTREVRLNGAVVKVVSMDDTSTRETKHISSFFQLRRVRAGAEPEEVSDLTKDLVFKNKINYITIIDYED